MTTEERKRNMLKKYNLSGVNKPKRTPGHKTKSHMVLAKQGDQMKIVRFGQQGVRGAGKNPKTAKDKARKNRIMHVTTRRTQTLQNFQHVTGHTKLSGNLNSGGKVKLSGKNQQTLTPNKE